MLTKQRNGHFQVKEVTEQGVVSGVLNHFDNKDHANDITLKGAFTKSLAELEDSGRNLVLLWQHQHDKPIGVWKNLRETAKGLEGEAHLNLETTLGREAYALVKQGAVTGFSIGYYVVDEDYDRLSGTNYLKEVSLMETSLVTFPCNDLSRVGDIKMKLKANQLPSQAELKELLTGTGVDASDADRICAKYFPDHKTEEEKQREVEAAKAQVEALISEFGLKYTTVDEAADVETADEVKQEDADDAEEPETEVKEEEEDAPAAEQEEKSNTFESFFK